MEAKTLRQCDHLASAAIRPPHYTAILQQTQDHAARGAAQGLDSIARREAGGPAKAFNCIDHQFLIQDTGDEMCNRRCGFLATKERQIREEGDRQRASDFAKRVAVEEKKWRAPMAGFEELQGLQQRQLRRPAFFPFFRSRRVSFRVNASLRAASFAESAVDLGDKCPAPVLEKVGSAL